MNDPLDMEKRRTSPKHAATMEAIMERRIHVVERCRGPKTASKVCANALAQPHKTCSGRARASHDATSFLAVSLTASSATLPAFTQKATIDAHAATQKPIPSMVPSSSACSAWPPSRSPRDGHSPRLLGHDLEQGGIAVQRYAGLQAAAAARRQLHRCSLARRRTTSQHLAEPLVDERRQRSARLRRIALRVCQKPIVQPHSGAHAPNVREVCRYVNARRGQVFRGRPAPRICCFSGRAARTSGRRCPRAP